MSDLIKMVSDENAVEFQQEIQTQLNNKLRDALDAKRQEVSNSVFQTQEVETDD